HAQPAPGRGEDRRRRRPHPDLPAGHRGALVSLRTAVVVVGGGTSGLSSALFLAWHGVPCLLVERQPDVLHHPRARGLAPRTMEVFRQVCLEPALLEAAYSGADFAWVPVQAETLNDEEYRSPDEPWEDGGSDASPCGFGPVDQDRLETVLRAEA